MIRNLLKKAVDSGLQVINDTPNYIVIPGLVICYISIMTYVGLGFIRILRF